MGRYYAKLEGEQPAICDAIAEHYAPQGPSDRCPTAPASVAVALADRIDTLAGFFAIGDTPTGSKDPYALRRAALGLIRLVVENGLRLPLAQLFATAGELYVTQSGGRVPRPAPEQLLEFLADRLKVALREKGVRHDLIAAVFALGGEDDLVRLLARVHALEEFLASEAGASLLTAFRRASNIVRIEEKRDAVRYDALPDCGLLRLAEEQTLHRVLDEAGGASGRALKDEKFAEAMGELARLREPVDRFFDKVTVNCEDAGLRANRLRLLSQIRATLCGVADFSRIEG
jgi:glycyl-tRNA synthetase beta chain